MEITVDIYTDRMVLTGGGKSVTVTPAEPYSSSRLLVGHYSVAERCIRDGVQRLGATGLFKRKPKIIVQPRELVDGGLSEVEDRCFRELALAAGAGEVEVVA